MLLDGRESAPVLGLATRQSVSIFPRTCKLVFLLVRALTRSNLWYSSPEYVSLLLKGCYDLRPQRTWRPLAAKLGIVWIRGQLEHSSARPRDDNLQGNSPAAKPLDDEYSNHNWYNICSYKVTQMYEWFSRDILNFMSISGQQIPKYPPILPVTDPQILRY